MSPPTAPATGEATPGPKPTSAQHVGGLDTVRLICALIVVFGHFGFVPLPSWLDRSHGFGRLFAAVYNNSFCGPAAVIVFFVISGFCIHYPYRSSATIPYVAYYARRYVRILVPMGVAIVLGSTLGVNLALLTDSILWSLVAEEIYYLLYPLIRKLREKVSFRVMIGVAYGASMLVALTNPRAANYASYGASLNWLLGLPCWLLGCELADSMSRPRPVPTHVAIWAWRLGVWGLATVCSVLRFHTPITYPWTLNAFAVVAALWLAREIAYRRQRPPPHVLERGGRWSYSIYLVHLQGDALFLLLPLSLGMYPTWLLRTAFTLVFCYVFARAIEFPSHRLARLTGARLLARTKPLDASTA